MAFLLLLPLCVEVALAHGVGHDASTGVCGYRDLSVRLSTGGPICLPDAQGQTSLATGESDVLWPHGVDGRPCGNGTSCDIQLSPNWTFSSPCFASPNSKEDICVFTDSNFAQGRGISLITTRRRADFVASHQAFTEPDIIKDVNQDLVRTIPAVYDIKEFPGKGLGLIAKRHIRRGEPIMANTPSLFIDYRSFKWLTTTEYRELQVAAIEHLPEVHQAAVMRLSTHDDASNLTVSEIVDKITTTNSFDIDSEEGDEEQEHGFFVVFPEISRMNHDCRPNADYYFDYDTMTHNIHAIRDILPGEELTLSYISPLLSRRERLRRLKRSWGFKCGCHACTREDAQSAASDDRTAQINALVPDFRTYKPASRATPDMAELLISLYQQENLWGTMYEAYTYAALEYNGIGEAWTATKYARLAIEYGIPTVGPKHNDVIEMEDLAEDPWNHWSWMLRSRRRMSWGKSPVSDDEE